MMHGYMKYKQPVNMKIPCVFANNFFNNFGDGHISNFFRVQIFLREINGFLVTIQRPKDSFTGSSLVNVIHLKFYVCNYLVIPKNV
jgi:hypothetical protein